MVSENEDKNENIPEDVSIASPSEDGTSEEAPQDIQETVPTENWAELQKVLDDERKKAAESAKQEVWQHFQSVNAKELSKITKSLEEQRREAQATAAANREIILRGITDPDERSAALREHDAIVKREMAKVPPPSQEQLDAAAEFNEKLIEARTFALQLKLDGGIKTDFKGGKCSDPTIDMASVDTYLATAEAKLKALRGGKPEVKETPKEPPKKAPRVDEGRGTSGGKRVYTVDEIANMSADEYAKNMKDIKEAQEDGRIK